ncbi:hypothetical protein AWB76_06224 [Caballeronia temeraria]|uniref:Uncharacterized protein n=1 Tax=Caballeronia temeraria TaxID=1777137 RepID=A0A158CZD3_9BURK|nr:hypothetical protein [Caballeronia temeraria]SAK87725.1 hypothetical protein AWB76_06224 [Caballeronia temeraria]
MSTHHPYSVVLTYHEDQQRLSIHAVEPEHIAPLLVSKLEMPVLLDEFNFSLDDEFARRLGVAVLNLIALGQPEIKQYMHVTATPPSQES